MEPEGGDGARAPRIAGASAGVQIFLTSATLLFAELLLIRWIPANVIYIGFFSNFLLVGSFLGMGLGTLLGIRFARPRVSPFAPLLLGVVLLVTHKQLDLRMATSDFEVLFLPEGANTGSNLVLPLVVLLVTLLMASLALPLGPLLRSMPPLRAYAIDIAGALVGIAGFTGLCAAWTGPLVWFSVLAGLLALRGLALGPSVWSLASVVAMAGVLGVASGSHGGGTVERWSPYYRVGVYPWGHGAGKAINVNGIPHQTFGPMPQDLPRNPPYEQVYRWFPERTFERVLVVGAGSGNDLVVALRHGAREIDAVEIDPLIARIGRDEHPNAPYADSRVHSTIDDGRSYLRHTDKLYDLILFAAPDSLTVQTTTNVRMESFLFTREAFEDVKAHLAPGGIFVLNNVYWRPWLVERLAAMLEEVFGVHPLVRPSEGRLYLTVLASGPLVASLGDGLPPGDAATRPHAEGAPCASTDDWPFPYLLGPGLPRHYVVALSIVLLVGVVLVGATCRVSGLPLGRFSPHFFLLGAAFLLLETRSLVTFSLLFGVTWVVNSLTFFAILSSVLAATALNAFVRFERPAWLYASLAASLLVCYFVPPSALLIGPPAIRYALASAVAFAPIFFSNLVFTRSFRDTRTADMAFASNLLGAAFGGALEYLSLVMGFRALLLVALGLYGLAFVAMRWQVLGDREPVV